MLLTPEETLQFITLLQKASGKPNVTGKHEVIVTPPIYAPEDFQPRRKVCVGDIKNVVGEVQVTAT